jgi:tRNA-splicing ligase RtcB
MDENGFVWVMLHSGSRGAGNKIGMYFIEQAKEEMRRYFVDKFLPDQDLAYLVDHTELFDDYVEAVHWAQDFAMVNRKAMMGAVLRAIRKTLPAFELTETAVNCHHNYVSREHHFGENVLVTRKGAVRAREGDLGIIPGSMGTGSFIVRGKGNADSFHSCSHGAGRAMSRGAAKKAITLAQHAEAMKGIEGRLDADVIDESPTAYKDVNAVMAAQSDLVDIVHRLRQVVNVKG